MTLNAGTGHYVEVSSENGQASADAVRFVSIGPLPLSMDTASLGDGVLGQMYSETLMASGGDPPYTWQVIAGTLPDGLTLNASSGEISGIPTTVESQMFTVEVEDGNGNTDDAVLTIDVVSAVVEIIIDNEDTETESTGTWPASSGPNPWRVSPFTTTEETPSVGCPRYRLPRCTPSTLGGPTTTIAPRRCPIASPTREESWRPL